MAGGKLLLQTAEAIWLGSLSQMMTEISDHTTQRHWQVADMGNRKSEDDLVAVC